MQWFRMYTEARNDAKLRSLTDGQFRVWFNLLCFAAEQPEERGAIIGYDLDLLAVEVAGGDTELLTETLERLERLRILDRGDDSVGFRAFADRQYDKPSDAPESARERKRRQRERDAKRDMPVTTNDVTPMSRDVTPCHALDTEAEADTDSDTEAEAEEAREALPAAVRETAEVLNAAPWITDAVTEIARSTSRAFSLVPAFHQPDGPLEAEKFVRYHTGKPPKDWYRAYLNWLKNAARFTAEATNHGRASPRREMTAADYAAFADGPIIDGYTRHADTD